MEMALTLPDQSDMQIIDPSFTIEHLPAREDVLRRIEEAGRTCYKSEDRITTGSGSAFVEKILASGHESVIEHASMTVRFICDRGVTHELVRHRLAAFSQESTRYCNYSKGKFGGELTFIRPPFWRENSHEFKSWAAAMAVAENVYLDLIDKGCKPQEARSVLPNSLKTEIVVTANVREWRHIFRLRCSKRAHPQMRQIMVPLLSLCSGLIPELFGGFPQDCYELPEDHTSSAK